MIITEKEMLHLIKHSDRDHVLSGTFGPQFVSVSDTGWEAEMVRQLRKNPENKT